MKVRLAASARAYLRVETAYLKRYSQRAALAFVAQMQEARDNLAEFPALGRGIGHLPIPGMHRLIVGDYVLDYDVNEEEVVILAIRHGRQQPPEEPEPDFDYEN